VNEPAATAAGGRGLLRSSAVVAVGTGLSRVTGLLRTVVLAWALGTTVLADSFNLANTTPNILYDLLLGGILSATLVPVFVDNLRNGDDEGTDAIVTVTTVLLVAATALTVLAAPWIVSVYTGRMSGEPERLAQLTAASVPLLRLFLIQIVFYGLTTLATGLLNTRDRFAAAAFAPVLNNVVAIGVLVAFRRLAGSGAPTVEQVTNDAGLLWLLGLGTTAGIVAMALVLWPAVRRAGIAVHWRFQPRHPSVIRVVRLSGWTVGYVIANQVALFVVLRLAVGAEEGAASAYSYAYLFFQLPYGLFAASVMTAAMPELSRRAAAGDRPGFAHHFGTALRLVVVVVLPLSVLLVILARPTVSILLERGAFSAASTELTATTLAAFAVGLVGFSVYLLAMRGFYAHADTRTPFFINVGENLLNVVLAVALVGRYGVTGLALAFALAYLVAGAVALWVLRAKVGGLIERDQAWLLAKIAVAAVALGIVGVLLDGVVGANSGAGAWLRVSAVGVAAMAAYGVALAVLGALPDELTRRAAQRRATP
jgi:putative peptidoglycan lipid II flippase